MHIRSRTIQVRKAIFNAVLRDFDSSDDIFIEELFTIKELDLSCKKITSLQPIDFNGLGHLEVLNLEGNLLSKLPRGIFEGLFNLKELNLSNNLFFNLLPDTFLDLSNLSKLHLQKNNFIDIPENVFNGLPGSLSVSLDKKVHRKDDSALMEGVC